MMLVKCQICKKQIDKDTAYKITKISSTNGTKTNNYYCSEEEFLQEEERKEKAKRDKDRVYYLISDMFGYEIQNRTFFNELALWNKLKPNAIIYEYIRENEEYLQSVCDREYKNENSKIMYFSAILKNSLVDFVPGRETKRFKKKPSIVKDQVRVVTEEHYETKYKAKSRQALEDFEEDDDE